LPLDQGIGMAKKRTRQQKKSPAKPAARLKKAAKPASKTVGWDTFKSEAEPERPRALLDPVPKGKKTEHFVADTSRFGVEPSVRTFTTWTPALIRSAEQQADAGNLRAAANLVDFILSDDRVQGTVHTRVQSLLGLDPTFEKSGDRRRSNAVVNALEAKEDWWASYPETDLATMVTWGTVLGVAPMRHRWLSPPGHGGRVLPLPEFWHPQHLRFDWGTREWKIKVQADAHSQPIEEVLNIGDGTWILHTPYGVHRPWAFAPWRGLARWVLLKWYAISDWAKASEKSSLLVGTSDVKVNSSAPQRDQLANDIYARGREGVAILPPGFDLKLLSMVSNTEAIFRQQIEMADTAIAIAIRGGNLTTEVQAGSRAAAEAQERLGDDVKRRFDGQALTTTLHDQSLVYWAWHNFGDPMLAPWPVYPTGPKRDMHRKAVSLSVAIGALERAAALGVNVDQQAFIDEFEMTGIFTPGPGPLIPPKPALSPQPSTPNDTPTGN
jgi:hypothetical protein